MSLLHIGRLSKTLPLLVPILRSKRVLIVSTSPKRSVDYLTHLLQTSLKCARVDVFVPPGKIKEDPSVNSALAAIELMHRVNSQVVFAIGGSAAMDLAKFVCGKSKDFEHNRAPEDEPLPLVSVPMVPCAGREVSNRAELYDRKLEELWTRTNVRPTATMIDGELAVEMDGVRKEVDALAFVSTLAVALNAKRNERVDVEAFRNGIHYVLADGEARKGFQREAILKASASLDDDDGTFDDAGTYHGALTRALALRFPVPRSVISACLFMPLVVDIVSANPEQFRFIQSVTGTSSVADARAVLGQMVKIAKVPENGLLGVLESTFKTDGKETVMKMLENTLNEVSVAFPESKAYKQIALDALNRATGTGW